MNIKKIIKEEIGKPSVREFEQAIKDVRPMIPSITHKIIHDENLEHNQETVIKINNDILEKIRRGDDEILDQMWEMAGSMIIKNAINIITFYTR